jgi:hypothetical protein
MATLGVFLTRDPRALTEPFAPQSNNPLASSVHRTLEILVLFLKHSNGADPMISLYIGITDWGWYQYLSQRPDLTEVNFWQPSGNTSFKKLTPGELFLFKLHAPA